MAKLIVSPPGILFFYTVSSCHYITRAKVCLLYVIIVHAVRLAVSDLDSVSQCENLAGGQNLANRSGPKFTKFRSRVWESV